MQVSSELLSKSFLCSCSVWVHEIGIEISHPLTALFGNCNAEQQERVGKGQRSLLTLWVAVGGCCSIKQNSFLGILPQSSVWLYAWMLVAHTALDIFSEHLTECILRLFACFPALSFIKKQNKPAKMPTFRELLFFFWGGRGIATRRCWSD